MIVEKLFLHLQKVSVIHIILISFAVHMFLISMPHFEILDEFFFTNFVRWFMLGMDHTPFQLNGLSFIVAPFVYVFGDNWFSWRFPIILLGMVFLYFYYKVIEHITNKKISLLSTIILSLSPMIFVHSHLMLRDIPVMALGFMAIYLYLKKKYYFAFFIIGLSALIKETAIFFVMFITLHYIITNHHSIILKILSRKFSRVPIIAFLVMAGSFLIPLTVYENTITVFEYNTVAPEYVTVDKDGKLVAFQFEYGNVKPEIFEIKKGNFNYIKIVKDPIHHLNLLFTKGYYFGDITENDSFLRSFIPIFEESKSPYISYKGSEQVIDNNRGKTVHRVNPTVAWDQSSVNFSYWHIAFYSCIILSIFALFQRFKNNISIPENIKFILPSFVFFAPFLFIMFIRDSYAYYIIYFLPFMAFGLITIIHRVSNNTLRCIILLGLFTGILFNFAYNFPIWMN